MPDQWDPKWPGSQEQWKDQYEKASHALAQPGSLWAPVFQTIVAADDAGEFRHLREIYKHSQERLGLWPWRWALWEMYCVPIFEKSPWPTHINAVFEAVPTTWPSINEPPSGIPTTWRGKTQQIWAFKATVTLIGGLVEKELSRTSQVIRRIESFLKENASAPFREEIQALLPSLGEALSPIT